MKRVIVAIAMIMATMTSHAQNAKKDASGNYVAIAATKTPDKSTGNTFTDTKGIKYPVYESAKGKLYYMRTSKAGNQYKVYIKL